MFSFTFLLGFSFNFHQTVELIKEIGNDIHVPCTPFGKFLLNSELGNNLN